MPPEPTPKKFCHLCKREIDAMEKHWSDVPIGVSIDDVLKRVGVDVCASCHPKWMDDNWQSA